jgi:hypothetical protein
MIRKIFYRVKSDSVILVFRFELIQKKIEFQNFKFVFDLKMGFGPLGPN